MLSALQKDAVAVEVDEATYPEVGEVDATHGLRARPRAAILTNDYNLNRVADHGHPRLEHQRAANAVKAVVHPARR